MKKQTDIQKKWHKFALQNPHIVEFCRAHDLPTTKEAVNLFEQELDKPSYKQPYPNGINIDYQEAKKTQRQFTGISIGFFISSFAMGFIAPNVLSIPIGITACCSILMFLMTTIVKTELGNREYSVKARILENSKNYRKNQQKLNFPFSSN